ncbi:MAG: esterase [Alcaligenaceae bacterium]|nr:esterase [Alcaligenaceae bacterium]
MNSPLDFGEGLSAELVPFTAGDGMALNLIRVRGTEPPTRGPVVLVHGAGVRANIFNPPLPITFVRHLVERGHDVWLENWRASIDVPRNEWTLDQAAVHDHPAAVRTVCERSGAASCAAVIHCQGSTSFMMSALAGLVPQVNLVISNAVSLHPVLPEAARVKNRYLVPIVSRIMPYLDPRWGDHPTGVLPRILQAWVRLTHRECDNGVCCFSSFTYGAGHPTLWPHENLTPEVHEWIRKEFADVPLSFFMQMRRCALHGNLVALGNEPSLPKDLAAQPPQTDARFVLIAGAVNDCFLADSQRRTFQWLEGHAPGRHQLHILPGYGHLDIFIGTHAARDVYPVMSDALEHGA